MLGKQRQKSIIELLSKKEFIKSMELADIHAVSFETIRRDLEYLESQKLIKRVHGGATLFEEKAIIASYSSRINLNNEKKQQLGKNAVNLICDGDTIFIDNGTTSLHLAKAIAEAQFKQLTVITNSLEIPTILAENDNVIIILLGGILDAKKQTMHGYISVESLKNYFADKAFISVTGISISHGISDFDIDTLPVQKEMLHLCSKKYVMADSSKFQSCCMYKICDLSDVDAIITDNDLPDMLIDLYTDRDCTII